MYKWSFARNASVFVILAITSTSVFGQSGRFRDPKVMRNDLSRKEKSLVTTSKVQSDASDETHAAVDRDHQSPSTPTKPIQKQQLTDEEVVSIIIVTALVLIVFVGLRKT